MRFISFTANGKRRFGIVEGDDAKALPERIDSLETMEVEIEGIGVLRNRVASRSRLGSGDGAKRPAEGAMMG